MIPRRLHRLRGRHALVDGIPFELPVNSKRSPALMAAFSCDHAAARDLIPSHEVHPLVLPNGRAVLFITVIDYRETDIGRYIEYSIAIPCTHGRRPAPLLLAGIFQRRFGTGQFVVDLPVSTEISVKGGKGIWGMPKHRANLDFVIGEDTVSSQYDLDGQLCTRIEIDRPRLLRRIPLSAAAVNYCAFRGLLMKSSIFFKGRIDVALGPMARARFLVGDHPRVAVLKGLDLSSRALFTAFIPESEGVLDDHFEGWMLSYPEPPADRPEGLESVADLGLGEEWLPAPDAAGR
jgi:hypothetical protein